MLSVQQHGEKTAWDVAERKRLAEEAAKLSQDAAQEEQLNRPPDYIIAHTNIVGDAKLFELLRSMQRKKADPI